MNLAPRTFGETLGEKFVINNFNELTEKVKGDGKHFDAWSYKSVKAEIKLSRAKVQVQGDVVAKVMSPLSNEYVNFDSEEDFLCNFQQVKPAEFGVIHYGIFFNDVIMLFKATSIQIENDAKIYYTDKQHKGNVGEGQFAITRRHIQHHLDNYLTEVMSWEKFVEIINL